MKFCELTMGAEHLLTNILFWIQVMPAWDLAAQKLQVHDPSDPEIATFRPVSQCSSKWNGGWWKSLMAVNGLLSLIFFEVTQRTTWGPFRWPRLMPVDIRWSLKREAPKAHQGHSVMSRNLTKAEFNNMVSFRVTETSVCRILSPPNNLSL